MRDLNFAEALKEVQKSKLGERSEFEKLLKEYHVKIEPMSTERGRTRDNKRERGGSDTEGNLQISALPDKESLSATLYDDPRSNIQTGRSKCSSSSSTQARPSFKTNPSTPTRNQKMTINNQPNLMRPTTSASRSVTFAPFTTILNETPSRNSFNPITPTSLPPAANRSNDSEDLSPASDDEITPTRLSNKRGKKRLRFAEDDIDANQYEPSSPENTRQIGHSQNFKRPRSNTDVNFNQAGTSAREDETVCFTLSSCYRINN
ncbi:hypothetical protein BKA69DRAFT_1068046 [Paraphysoderma sedebokerense]|nr:hypothetical protein BKA69DRAFT_1068046 [Paraphysoderma sedebokerense]